MASSGGERIVIIQAKKTVLTCPETGQEVVLQKDCLNPKGDGVSCPFFKHFGIRGNHVWIACKSTKIEYLPAHNRR